MKACIPFALAAGALFAIACTSSETSAPPGGEPSGDGENEQESDGTDGPSRPSEPSQDGRAPSGTRCSKDAPFGAPEKVTELADIGAGDPWISGDGKTLLIAGEAPNFKSQLKLAERAVSGSFAAPSDLDLEGWKGDEYRPSLSADAKTLYFTRGSKVMKATRATTSDPFANTEEMSLDPPAGSTAVDLPRPAGDGLYFTAYESNKRWGVFRRAGNVTTPVFPNAGRIGGLAITSDEKTIYIAFDEGEGEGEGWTVYRGARSSASGQFSTPVLVKELATPPSSQGFGITGVSDDDCEVYGFVLSLSGEMRTYRATRGE